MTNCLNRVTKLLPALFIFIFTGLTATGQIYVDCDIASSGNGSTWAAAYKTLQEGLTAATSGNQIWVKKGTYYPTVAPAGCSGTLCSDPRAKAFLLKNGVGLYGGFQGTETTLSQRISGQPTILSGDIGTAGVNSDNCYHIIIAPNLAPGSAILNGFTITNGNANNSGLVTVGGESIFCSDGPAIYASSFSINISNCFITENRCYSNESINAVYLGGQNSKVTNCVFFDNSGGAVALFTGSGSYAVTNCTFVNNTNNNTYGTIYSHASPVITNCIVWGGKINTSGALGAPVVNNSIVQGGYSGTGNQSLEPEFVDAANPKGADGIFGTADDGIRLGCNSPAINKGDNNAASAISSDILGGNRVQYTTVDLGAYESAFDMPTTQSSVTISSDQAVACAGANITFTATPVLGGTTPTYRWFKNNVEVASTTTPTYVTSFTSSADSMHVRLTSSACALSSFSTRIGARVKNIPSGIAFVDAGVTASGTGGSWAQAFKTLQEALELPASCVQQIWVKKGTYYPNSCGACNSDKEQSFSLKNGVAIYGGFSGTETSLSQRNYRGNPTILSGDIGTPGNNTDNTRHIVTAVGVNRTAVLDGFTVRDGYAYNTSGDDLARGGGALIHSDATISNCLFLSNYASNAGGALYIKNSPLITNCVFSGIPVLILEVLYLVIQRQRLFSSIVLLQGTTPAGEAPWNTSLLM